MIPILLNFTDILSEHKLCEEEGVTFESFQNMEQLNKCLISLRLECILELPLIFFLLTCKDDELRQKGISCPNEAEFRAYFILAHIQSDVLQYCRYLILEVY